MRLDIVASVYNEEEGIEAFYEECSSVLMRLEREKEGLETEILFVNDGSTDGTAKKLGIIHEKDPAHTSVITFSRNFGHEAAMTAGLDYSSGDYIIFMDSDLQHPVECIPQIMEEFSQGSNIVCMVRKENKTAGFIRNITSRCFYSIINMLSKTRLEPGASDFFALDKTAAEVLRKNCRDKVRFLRGFVQNIGFKKTVLEYNAAERTAGRSHYSIWGLFRFSVDTILCFSDMPLKLGIFAGAFSGLCGVILILYTFITRGDAPRGYATVVVALCFMFAVMFFIVGVIGEYISVIFREIKDMPVYIVENLSPANKQD